MSAFLFSPEGNLHVIPASEHWQTKDLLTVVSRGNEVVCPDSVYISFNGRLLQPCDTLSIATQDVVRVTYRVPGGKGGFGSMLRAIGAQIEKTTSREACRDLSGRRMRDVNDEKKITEWVAKQADRERDLAKQKQERLEKRRAEPKHNFDDRTYTKQIQQNSEKIDDALKQGFKASTSTSGSLPGIKRTSTISREIPKKRKMWMDVDEEELDDSDDETLQRLSDQSSSSTSTISTATITASTSTSTATASTSTADASVESSKRDGRLTDQSSSSTSIDTNYTLNESTLSTSTESTSVSAAVTSHTAINTDSSSEGNMEQRNKPMELAEFTVSKTKEDEEPCTKEDNIIKKSQMDKKSLPFNINDYNTAKELESLGLEGLKVHLKALGLKCGGTLQERTHRLFATKAKALEDLDPSLFAKPSRGKNKRK